MIFFLFLHKNECCWYSLEAHQRVPFLHPPASVAGRPVTPLSVALSVGLTLRCTKKYYHHPICTTHIMAFLFGKVANSACHLFILWLLTCICLFPLVFVGAERRGGGGGGGRGLDVDLTVSDPEFTYLLYTNLAQLDLSRPNLKRYTSFVLHITKTRLYNFDPLKPHFYIVKLGFTGVYIVFLTFAQKPRLLLLVRTAMPRLF